jgi:hypothetical protein
MAFKTFFGHFDFVVVSFGLTNVSVVLMSLMNGGVSTIPC